MCFTFSILDVRHELLLYYKLAGTREDLFKLARDARVRFPLERDSPPPVAKLYSILGKVYIHQVETVNNFMGQKSETEQRTK